MDAKASFRVLREERRSVADNYEGLDNPATAAFKRGDLVFSLDASNCACLAASHVAEMKELSDAVPQKEN